MRKTLREFGRSCVQTRAVERSCKNLGFLGFLQKYVKTSKFQILGFSSFKKNVENPDLRLTVTAENCCLTV